MQQKFLAIFSLCSTLAVADSGFYVGVGAGYGTISNTTANGYQFLDNSTTTNGGNIAGMIYGGYDFSRYVGIQMDYIYIANIAYSTGTANNVQGSFNASQQVLDLGIIGHFPFGIFTNSLSGLSIFGKLAVGYATTSFNGGYVENGQALANDQELPTFAQGLVPVIGGGVEYGINSVGVRLEYNYIGTTTANNSGINLMNSSNNLVMLSVMYHF